MLWVHKSGIETIEINDDSWSGLSSFEYIYKESP